MATSAALAVGGLPDTIATPVDFTVSSFGSPDAVIMFSNGANATNPQATAWLSAGFWDTTNDYSVGISSGDALGSGDTARNQSLTDIVVHPHVNIAYNSIRGSASSVTDGVRVTLTEDNTGVNRKAAALLLKGLTNKYVGSVTLAASTSPVDVTAPGFKPDLVLFLGTGSTTTLSTQAIFAFGAAHNNSSDVISQGSVSFTTEEVASPSKVCTAISATKCLTVTFPDTISFTLTASDFDANGFSVTCSDGTRTDRILYIALEFADPDDVYVGVVDSATGTGNTSYTGTGFTPQALILAQTMCTAVDTLTQEGYIGFGVADASTQISLNITDEDAVGTTDTESYADLSNILNLQFDTPAADAVAALSSFDSNGWTLNYSDGSASARKMLAIAIGDSTAGGGPSIYMNGVLAATINGVVPASVNGVS